MTHLDYNKPLLYTWTKYQDERGSLEINYANHISYPFAPKQILTNICYKNVMKGLHLHYNMSKMVRVLDGFIMDIAVDFNKESETFLFSTETYLSKESGWLYIPKGYGHGIIFLTESRIEYLFSEIYDSKDCINLKITDPDINYSSQFRRAYFENSPVYHMSEKDANAQGIKEWLSQ